MSGTELAGVDLNLDFQHVSSIVLGAVIIGATAAWVTSALATPLLVFPVAALVSGYLLSERPDDREKLVFVGYAVTGLLLVSPLLFFLPDVLSGRTVLLSQMMTVVITRFLLFITAIVGYIVYRLAGGAGVVERARNPDLRRGLAGYLVAAVLVFLPFVLFVLGLFGVVSALETLSPLLWRVVGLLAVGIAYAAYRLDGGRGVAERVQSVTA